VSLAFADNISSGIEPPYAWRYIRHRKLHRSMGTRAYDVEDHAWRVYRKFAGDQADLTTAFVGALELSP
jgi:ribonucleoside-diphosphate reductase alpha chain